MAPTAPATTPSDQCVYTGLTIRGTRQTIVELRTVPHLFGVIDTEAELFWVCNRRTQQATATGQRPIDGRTFDELVDLLATEIAA